MFEKIFLGLIFLGWHQMYLCNEHTYGTFRIGENKEKNIFLLLKVECMY